MCSWVLSIRDDKRPRYRHLSSLIDKALCIDWLLRVNIEHIIIVVVAMFTYVFTYTYVVHQKFYNFTVNFCTCTHVCSYSYIAIQFLPLYEIKE